MRGLVAIGFIWILCSGFAVDVTKVSDGDTLVAKDHNGKTYKVRLARVDCPEKNQPHGKEAAEFTRDLVMGDEVDLKIVGDAGWGRKLGEITLPDGRNLSDWLVIEGHAWWYQLYAPADLNLEWYQDHAQRHRLGLWESDGPIPPWSWRRGERQPAFGHPPYRATRLDWFVEARKQQGWR